MMYNSTYDRKEIRNDSYNVFEYIGKYYKSHFLCLDLGCGSCRKISQISNKVKLYYAVDFNSQRIADAFEINEEYPNIILGVADNFYLPFKKESFNLVSSFMTKHSVMEVNRVLKPEGLFIVETTGANDKRNFKLEFGKDHLGFRGRMLEDTIDEQLLRIRKSLTPFFEIRDIYCKEFVTTISTKFLTKLLEMTNEIRNFDITKDKDIMEKLSDNNGNVTYNEERIIIICQKKE